MIKRKVIRFLGLALGAGLTAGCQPQYPPDEDGILYYFRNAQVHGKVRRVWPEGQKYVEQVLEHNAKFKKAIAPLTTLEKMGALWYPEDPRWQDAKAVKEQVDNLTSLVEGDRFERQQALTQLREAVTELPASVEKVAVNKDDFIVDVWEALGHGPDPAALLESNETWGRAYLDLFKQVQTCLKHKAPESFGLVFEDRQCQETIDAQYRALRERLFVRREELIATAQSEIAAGQAGMKEIGPRKRDPQYRREYESLGYVLKYRKEQLNDIPKALNEAIRKREAELAELRAEKNRSDKDPAGKPTVLDYKIAAIEKILQQMKEDRDHVKPRIEAILKPAATRAEAPETA